MTSSRSLLLFIFLTLLLASCGGEPTTEVGESEAIADAPESSSGLVALLPESGAVPGWSQSGESRFFTPDNLWEFINGAADGYVLYGFEEVVTADYFHENTEQQAVIDIYQMKDPVHGFGIYCQERNPNYEFLEIGGEGYMGGTALNFWRGPYYVKLTVFEETDDLKAAMLELAGSISEKIDHPAIEPPEVTHFPAENRKPRSVQFIPRDVLGQSYLVNAFETHYQDGDVEYKIVLASMGDSDEAQEGMAKYQQFLSNASPEIEAIEGLGDEAFHGEDNFYGKVVALRSGNKILVILGTPTADAGKAVLAEMLEKIS